MKKKNLLIKLAAHGSKSGEFLDIRAVCGGSIINFNCEVLSAAFT